MGKGVSGHGTNVFPTPHRRYRRCPVPPPPPPPVRHGNFCFWLVIILPTEIEVLSPLSPPPPSPTALEILVPPWSTEKGRGFCDFVRSFVCLFGWLLVYLLWACLVACLLGDAWGFLVIDSTRCLHYPPPPLLLPPVK